MPAVAPSCYPRATTMFAATRGPSNTSHPQEPRRGGPRKFARVLTSGGRVIVHTPNGSAYFVPVAGCPAHGGYGWCSDSTPEREMFPAYSRGTMLRQPMTQVGFIDERWRMVASDTVLASLPLLAAVELLYIRPSVGCP
jgi:hypothetical protein